MRYKLEDSCITCGNSKYIVSDSFNLYCGRCGRLKRKATEDEIADIKTIKEKELLRSAGWFPID